MEKKFPARLHAILAKNSPNAIVFRRGPSKRVCTFLWDRRKDTFKIGQWLKGRIYERRADISPDGKYVIYFAMNGKWESETGGSWTAISKVPWLKAVELYRKGDCWEGGGLFLSNNRFWLNDRHFNNRKILKQSNKIQLDTSYIPEGTFGAECTGVYYRRLIRDRWRLIKSAEKARWNVVTIFEKFLSKGWVLRKIAHEQVDSPEGKGCYWDEHELFNDKSDKLIKCRDWEWADSDGKSLVWAANGCIYRAFIQSSAKIKNPKLLYNLNSFEFERIRVPY